MWGTRGRDGSREANLHAVQVHLLHPERVAEDPPETRVVADRLGDDRDRRSAAELESQERLADSGGCVDSRRVLEQAALADRHVPSSDSRCSRTRSTFPVDVRGSSSKMTTREGTM